MNELQMVRILNTCPYPQLREGLSVQIRALFAKYLEFEERAAYMRAHATTVAKQEKVVTRDGDRTILRFRRVQG